MPPFIFDMNNQQLRSEICRTRLLLPTDYVAQAEKAACQALQQQSAFKRAQRIAGFFGSKGELDPIPALIQAHDQGKQCYLPVLHPFLKGRLWFARWHPGHPLHKNRFGIPEPAIRPRDLSQPSQLDLVIVPLVAFDPQCRRMGMGGGYYDRSFAFIKRRRYWHRPTLIGFAFDLQKTDRLFTNPWDIPMHKIITERAIYQMAKTNAAES